MSPARKNLLMAACALGLMYLAWLATNVMKLLPPGPWTAWYVGFGILGVATVMAAVALRREAPSKQSHSQQSADSEARSVQTSSSSKPVKQLTRQTPQSFNEAAQPPEDLRAFNQHTFDDDNPDEAQGVHRAAYKVPSAVPITPKRKVDQLGLMLTPVATPEPPEPISFDEPSLGDYTPDTSTLAQWIQSQTSTQAKQEPSKEAQKHSPLAEAVQVGVQRSAETPRQTLTGLNASLTEPIYDHGAQQVAAVTANTTPSLDDNIKIMTSFGQRAEKSAAEQAFEDASLSSIDAAIKQYTVELYDMGDDDQFSRTLDEVLNIGSLSQAAQTADDSMSASNDPMTDTKRLRLEALKNKLSGPSQSQGGDLESLLSAATSRASSLPDRPSTTPQLYIDDYQAQSAPRNPHGVILEPFTQGLGAMGRDEINRLWQDYAEASVTCGRPSARISYIRFYQQLIQHHETISRQYDCDNIRFRIKIKNGKPALSARPA